MPDPVHWPHIQQPPHRPSYPQRSRRWVLYILGILVIIALGGRSWLSYYVDALWFGSLGYVDVFWKTLRLQSTVFTTFTAATFLILYGTFLALKPANLDDFSDGRTIFVGQQAVTLPVERILRWVAIAASVLVALVTGAIMAAQWPTFALYWFAPRTGTADPIFGKPLNFYLFTLPAWQLVAGWLMVLAVIGCAVAAFFLLATGGVRALQMPRGSGMQLSWRGFSITFAFLLVVIALQVYLGRFGQLFEDHTVFSGVTYTDAHIMLPGLLIICIALVVGAAIAASNAISPRGGRRLVIAVVPAVVCYVLLQVGAWYVTSFIVKPNELVREKPYIANNIKMTRRAYGLDRMTQREFPAETSVDAADAAEQSGHAAEHPAVGLARASGHAPADPGNPHLLRLSRYRYRPL